MGNASAYGVGGVHRHTPEIIQNLNLLTEETVRLSFTPLLVPMPRGILATVTARLTGPLTTDEAYEVYSQAYADEPFVHVLPQRSEEHPSELQSLMRNSYSVFC